MVIHKEAMKRRPSNQNTIVWICLSMILSLLGTSSLASPAVGAVCEVSGPEGNIVECPIWLRSADLEDPQSTSLQLGLSLPAGLELNQFTDGEMCIATVCFPYAMPTPNVTLQSGHTLSLSPTALWQWKDDKTNASEGSLLLIHTQTPDTPLTNGYVNNGALEGDAHLITLQITLTEEIPRRDPGSHAGMGDGQ